MAKGDDDLVDRAVAGDEDALVILLKRHGPTVRRALARAMPRRWRSVLALDDVMQQAYTDAFLNISGFAAQAEGGFVHWLTTFARCTLIDTIRMLEAEKRGGDRRRIELKGGPGSADASALVDLCEVLGATMKTPSQGAAQSEACAALRRALERLPGEQRRVVEMYDLAGRSAEQVAAALDRSVGAVYMLRARGHRRLCDLMGTESKYLSRRS